MTMAMTDSDRPSRSHSQICINILQVPYVSPIHALSYHVATDKPPQDQNSDKFRSIIATIYNQSQLAERKHAARYWLINTAATAVPLSVHSSPLVITTKLAAAILGGGVVRRRCSAGPVLPLWSNRGSTVAVNVPPNDTLHGRVYTGQMTQPTVSKH